MTPIKLEKFSIYKADLNPQSGTEPGKVRPVVVIQTDLINNLYVFSKTANGSSNISESV